MAVVGSAYVRLLPIAAGFADAAKAELQPELDAIAAQTAEATEAAGNDAGGALAGGLAAGAKDGEQDVEDAAAGLAGAGGRGLETLGDDADKAGKDAAAKMGGSFSKVSGVITNALGSLGLPFGNVGKQADQLGTKIAGAGTTGESGLSKLAGAGGLLTAGLVVGTVVAGAAALKLGVDFQNATTQLAAQGGITIDQARAIGNAFLTTGGQSIYSGAQMLAAYTPVAGLLTQLNGGIALTSGQAKSFILVANNLAEATGSNLNDATSTLASTLKTFGANTKDASTYADVLTSTSRALGTSIGTVGGTFDKLRSTLGTVTPSVGQLGGILIDLSDHGLNNVRKATSALNTSLTGLLTPTKAQQQAQGLLGLSVFNSQGQFQGFGSIIDQLRPKLELMPQNMQIAALKAIGFGNAAKSILPTILAGGDALDKATAAASRQGSAQAAAQKASQSLGHQWDTLKASAVDLGTQVGLKLLPFVTAFIHILVEGAQYLLQHKTLLLAIAVALGVLIAVPVLVFLAGLLTGVGGVAVVIAALAAGAILLATHWKQVWTDIKNWFDDAVQFIRSHMLLVLAAFGPFIGGVLIIATHWQQIWAGIQAAVAVVVNAVRPYMSALQSIVGGTFQTIAAVVTGAFGVIEAIVKTAWTIVYAVFNTTLGIITGIVKVFAALFTGNWTALWNAVLNIFRTVLSGLQAVATAIFNGLVGFFTAIWGTISGVFRGGVSIIEGTLSAAWTAVGGAISAAWSGIVSFFTGIPGAIVTALGSGLGVLLQWGKDLVTGIANGVTSAAGAISKALVSAVKGAVSDVKNAVNSIPVIGGALSAIGLATGGYVTKPTFALVGEAGPEFVIPAAQLLGGFSANVQPLPAGLGTGPAGAGSPATSSTAATGSAGAPAVLSQLLVVARQQLELLDQLLAEEKSPSTLTLLGQLPGSDAVQEIATGIAR